MTCEKYMESKFQYIGTGPHSFIYILSMVAFMLQWQTSVVVTKLICPTKPKTITI
jgi:hypothetical protein